MKIEEGKYYRSREGKKVGPMRRSAWMSGSWADHTGYLYDEDGRRHSYIGSHLGDLISEWKEEEPAMDYATMNDVVRFLREVRSALYAEHQRHLDDMRKIDVLIHQIESQYPKPDEEEK